MRPTQVRFLLFYSATLAIVLLLFRLTTAYGEANLKAPPNINGRYVTTEPLPGCPVTSRLAMTLQQSGIYLNGSLDLATVPEQAAIAPTGQLTFTGRWQQQIYLMGRTQSLAACRSDWSNVQATWQGTIANPVEGVFVGQFKLDGTEPWNFTAQRQKPAVQSSEH